MFSAPLASHRACQVSPGTEANQVSILITPRCRPARVVTAASASTEQFSRASTSSAEAAVCGHQSSPSRGGNCLCSWRILECGTGVTSKRSGRVMCLTAVLTTASRTARSTLPDRLLEQEAATEPADVPADQQYERGGPGRWRSPRPYRVSAKFRSSTNGRSEEHTSELQS